MKIKPVKTEKKRNSNLGMAFENEVSSKLEDYKNQGKAYGFKIPTDWVVQRKGKAITSAFPRAKSLLDYVVLLKNNRVLIIEAKSSNEKTSLPLSIIKDHQYVIAKEMSSYNDMVYYLIKFNLYNRVFLVDAREVQNFKDNNDRKSIPLADIEKMGIEIFDMDFLKPVFERYE